jgi:hypothetical protein
MVRRSDHAAARRLEQALDLSEAGIQMMALNLRRRHPQASAARIRELLDEWLSRRPGAELGDADGTLVEWPRSKR